MDMNAAILTILKFIIVMVYVLQYTRFMKAKRVDKSLKVRFDVISWFEIGIIALLNVAYMVFVNSATNPAIAIPAGFILLFITYYHIRRIVLLGKETLFVLDSSLDLKYMKHVSWETNALSFEVNHESFKVRRPVGHRKSLVQGLSGKQFKKGK